MILEGAMGETEGDEKKPLVLFAIEPHSYAEAIGAAIALMRPGLDVRSVGVGGLIAEMEDGAPAVVFSSEPRPDGDDGIARWAQYRPYDEPDVIRVDGVRHRLPGFDLENVLWLVDLHTVGARRRG